MEANGQLHAPPAVLPKKGPLVPINKEAGWAPRASLHILEKRKILLPFQVLNQYSLPGHCLSWYMESIEAATNEKINSICYLVQTLFIICINGSYMCVSVWNKLTELNLTFRAWQALQKVSPRFSLLSGMIIPTMLDLLKTWNVLCQQ